MHTRLSMAISVYRIKVCAEGVSISFMVTAHWVISVRS